MSEENNRCDVLVIGGGPAGSTVSTLLAEKGRRVTLLEKDVFPRFHIGESLLPLSLPIFERLGVADQVRAIGIKKLGAEFVSPKHDHTTTFYFAKALDKAHPSAYEVRRSELDKIMLDNAAAKGVDVHQGTRVIEVDTDTAGPCRVTAKDSQGNVRVWEAGFVVDASGRDTLMAGKLGAKQRNPKHASAAIFSHFEGCERLEGENEGNISIAWFQHGWFWFIPFSDGQVSVGAVCWPYYLKRRRGDLDVFLWDTIKLCPKLAERMENARMTMPAQATGNYSYGSNVMMGDRYMLVGDSYAFVDPVFSSGVHIALNSAVMAVDVIQATLDEDPQLPKIKKAYEKKIRNSLKVFSWFIYRITQPAMRGLFMNPRNILRVEEAMLSLLAGDLYRDTPVRQRLAFFKFLYYVVFVTHPIANIRHMLRRRSGLGDADPATEGQPATSS